MRILKSGVLREQERETDDATVAVAAVASYGITLARKEGMRDRSGGKHSIFATIANSR